MTLEEIDMLLGPRPKNQARPSHSSPASRERNARGGFYAEAADFIAPTAHLPFPVLPCFTPFAIPVSPPLHVPPFSQLFVILSQPLRANTLTSNGRHTTPPPHANLLQP